MIHQFYQEMDICKVRMKLKIKHTMSPLNNSELYLDIVNVISIVR